MQNTDEVLAQYLRHCSTIVNAHYYKVVIRFVLLYRDCFNQFGWLKRAEADCREMRMPLDERNV